MTSIENYSNYLVYNNGDVYNIKRKIFMKTRLDRDGYLRVDLRDDNKKAKTLKIHQLVAIAYLGHKLGDDNIVIDHIDDDKKNNYLHNLQIITRQQNSMKNAGRKKRDLPVGVYKTKNYYCSHFVWNKNFIWLGVFDSIEDASHAYSEATFHLMEGVKKKNT
jgi:predicted PolB exonuclease-like 3'-5' exonuclease|tara:strand:+ start:513 stop:998 length:486 start_codon:yes stop_codon:yes gene_type:complete